MADTARITQDAVEYAFEVNATARITQNVLEYLIELDVLPVTVSPPQIFSLPGKAYLDNTGAMRGNFPMKGRQ